jgi:hypothetical protein
MEMFELQNIKVFYIDNCAPYLLHRALYSVLPELKHLSDIDPDLIGIVGTKPSYRCSGPKFRQVGRIRSQCHIFHHRYLTNIHLRIEGQMRSHPLDWRKPYMIQNSGRSFPHSWEDRDQAYQCNIPRIYNREQAEGPEAAGKAVSA